MLSSTFYLLLIKEYDVPNARQNLTNDRSVHG